MTRSFDLALLVGATPITLPDIVPASTDEALFADTIAGTIQLEWRQAISFPEAPSDGKQYARQSLDWSEVAAPISHDDTAVNGLVIPYYLAPNDPYTDVNVQRLLDLMRQYHDVPVLVVINPASGPGAAASSSYAAFIELIQAAGGKVCGYVSTAYATRPEADVKADIDRWKTFYPSPPVDGIFLDEQTWDTGPGNVGSAYVDLYKRYTDYCHTADLRPVIANPGTNQQEAYFATWTADIILVHEQTTFPPEALMEGNYAGGHADYSYTRRGALVYNQPSLDTAELTILRKNVQWVYVTDDNMTGGVLNPWDALPTYLESLFAELTVSVDAYTKAQSDARYEPVVALDGDAFKFWTGTKTWAYPAWNAITGKPTTFAPSDHTHPAAQIPDFNESVDDRVSILLQPGTGIALAYDDAANTLTVTSTAVADWGSITGKPTTFPPSTHSHPISEVTGLQTALNSKEPTIATGDPAMFWAGDKTWKTVSGGGGGTPGGATTQVQYNNAGAFGGSAKFVYTETASLATLALGTVGTAAGKVSLRGTGIGSVLLDPGATTGYTFIFPAGNGLSGQVMISGGAGAHTWGVVTPFAGGTGVQNPTGILVGDGSFNCKTITNSSTVGQVLRVTGTNAYAWGALDLADPDAVTGVLPAINGGGGGGGTAATTTFTPTGAIAATNVQTALAEVDAEKLALAGGTLTGNITMTKSQPRLNLNKTSAGEIVMIAGQTNGLNRWGLQMGDSSAESGSNVGSNILFSRYDDAGAAIDFPFQISRSNGQVTTTQGLLTAASTAGRAGLTLPHGVAPTTPVNGDVWTTTAGVLVRINGGTTQLAKTSANTFSGTQQLVAGTTTIVPLRIPHGVAPTTLTDGDLWTTTAGTYVRVNGATVGPLIDSTSVSSTYLPLAGGTLTGNLTTVASVVGTAGLTVPHGVAPTAPTDGDIWTSTGGLFYRINGVSRQATHTGSNTFSGTQQLGASATGAASFRIPHGVAPSAPVNGDIWTSTLGLYARINGTTVGPYGAQTGSYLPIAGGTLSGDLVIAKTTPTIELRKTASAQEAGIGGLRDATYRWWVALGNVAPESTGNLGSNFEIQSYNDAGTYLASPLVLSRATGDASFSANLTIAGAVATKASGTTWANPSDERIKTDIADYPQGLAAIVGLRPRVFRFVDEAKQPDTLLVGLVAQEAEAVMPGIVTTAPGGMGDLQFEDFKSLDASNVLWALVNSCKELEARVRELEGRRTGDSDA